MLLLGAELSFANLPPGAGMFDDGDITLFKLLLNKKHEMT